MTTINKTFRVKTSIANTPNLTVPYYHPCRWRGSRENDLHYCVIGDLAFPLVNDIKCDIFYQDMWIPVYSIEVTSRDINKKFIVEVSMTNTSSNVDFNSTWLGRVIESGTTGDVKVTVSDFE